MIAQQLPAASGLERDIGNAAHGKVVTVFAIHGPALSQIRMITFLSVPDS